MQQIEQHTNTQFKYNSGKNMFANSSGLFGFIPVPNALTQRLDTFNEDEEDRLLNSITIKSLEAFYRLNQYYYFNSDAKKKLKTIYASLFEYLKNEKNLKLYEKLHFSKLKRWLAETNPFALELYADKNEILQNVVCETYNAQLQLDLLRINLNEIEQPVLDIGCGKNGELVQYLRKSGIKAFGFDRSVNNTEFCIDADWFDYQYGNEKWGTIISNLGFSNHFNHHHLRSDGNYIAYAQTYMHILHSLKHRGTFHYAPGLPFIEKFLNKRRFNIYTHNVFNSDYKATIVKNIFK